MQEESCLFFILRNLVCLFVFGEVTFIVSTHSFSTQIPGGGTKKGHPSLALGNWHGTYRNELRNMSFPPPSSPHSQDTTPMHRHLGEGRKIGTVLTDSTNANRPGGRKGDRVSADSQATPPLPIDLGEGRERDQLHIKDYSDPGIRSLLPHPVKTNRILQHFLQMHSLFLFLIVSQKLLLLLENRSEIQMLISRWFLRISCVYHHVCF